MRSPARGAALELTGAACSSSMPRLARSPVGRRPHLRAVDSRSPCRRCAGRCHRHTRRELGAALRRSPQPPEAAQVRPELGREVRSGPAASRPHCQGFCLHQAPQSPALLDRRPPGQAMLELREALRAPAIPLLAASWSLAAHFAPFPGRGSNSSVRCTRWG